MIIAYFLLIILSLLTLDLHHFLFPLTSQLHNLCLVFSPETAWKTAYQGIVCGQSLPPNHFSQGLKITGLIHVMVVSGSHLILLNKFFKQFLFSSKWGQFIASLSLLIYCGVCKLEPPVVRALLSLLLFSVNHHYKLFWSPLKTTHWAGLISLILFPEWFFSKSLLLSWMAAMSLHLSKNILISSLVCYLWLFPILLEFSQLSPWTILINASLAPLIGTLLFPLSLLTFFVPKLSLLIDPLWSLTSNLVRLLSQALPVGQSIETPLISIQFLWVFLFSTYYGFSLVKKYR